MNDSATVPAILQWSEAGGTRHANWRSEAGWAAPSRVQLADDRMPADGAYRLACEGTALLWRGDFHNARQLLQALARRVDRKPRKAPRSDRAILSPADRFYRYRQDQGRRARVLGMLLIELNADYVIGLGRAPDLREACTQAWGPPSGEPLVVALRELIGLVGAHEWRKKGVAVPALGQAETDRIHPHYGVFSPVRSEYLDLVVRAPLPADHSLAFDIGTGTGVIAALLARRGVGRVVATDTSARALACARDNLDRLGVLPRVELQDVSLFPASRAPLVVCNPPWVPARGQSTLERAVYDPDSQMLKGFLAGLATHLVPGGEGWLVLSDLAEHLGLRTREELLGLIRAGDLAVKDRLDIRPRHPRASDPDDPLAAARAKEVTSLWRLVAA